MSVEEPLAMAILSPAQVPAPPPPPPPPGVPVSVQGPQGSGGEAAARVADELARAREEVARITEQSVRDGPGNITVLRDGQGRTVVNTPDGRQIIIDPQAVPSLQGQEAIIREALTSVPPPVLDMRDPGPPQNAIVMTGLVLFFLTLMVIGFPLARAAARRMDRKVAGPRVPDDLAPRLDRLEQAVESVAIEMERVSEAQRFSARLLSERLPEALPRLDAAAESMQRHRVEG